MRLSSLATIVAGLAAAAFSPAGAQGSGLPATENTSKVGRPVRITPLPGQPLAPRLTGTLLALTADSIALRADSVQVIRAVDDPTRVAGIPCAACVEARLALATLERVELATLPPADAWKRTRRRGVIWGALVGGALFTGVHAMRSGGENLVGGAIPGVLLGAWLGGTIGAGWRHPLTWQTVYEAPARP